MFDTHLYFRIVPCILSRTRTLGAQCESLRESCAHGVPPRAMAAAVSLCGTCTVPETIDAVPTKQRNSEQTTKLCIDCRRTDGDLSADTNKNKGISSYFCGIGRLSCASQRSIKSFSRVWGQICLALPGD